LEVIVIVFYNYWMRVAQIRKAKGLSQSELASMIGVEQPTISRIEKGSDGVTLRLLNQVAEALGVETASLFIDSRVEGEEVILRAFRSMTAERQQGWLDLAVVAMQGRLTD
jgi:transcriptional regulator with XRE-family HTH domain